MQVCTRCIMDESDPEISFDAEGVCNHCHEFDAAKSYTWYPEAEHNGQLEAIIEVIKARGKDQEYDCILGLSGGIDSSYLALRAKEWGLRPLVVHVDAGWNSELSVANIEKIVTHCGYDLHTHVIDWEDMRNLQLAYLKAGLANQDVPQDHAFFAGLYQFAVKHKIKTVLSGGNFATESVFAKSWHGSAMDAINLKAVHRRHGSGRLKRYPLVSWYDYYLMMPFLHGMRVVRPLNYLDYNKDRAIEELQAVGYRPYPRKHGESVFTKWFQDHYLPTKFGYDKRKLHYSSLVLAGQMTRDQALTEMAKPLYDARELENDMNYFCKKLRISRDQLDGYLAAPNGHYTDYPNWDSRLAFLNRLRRFAEQLRGRRIKGYS